MNLTVLRILLASGIAGHALNMYCDRLLSVFPHGMLKLEDLKDIGNEGKMAKLLEGVSADVPMRSAILGAFSLLLQLFGYCAITAYIYGHSVWYGSILFVSIALFLIIGTAHHVKYSLGEYVFIRLGRDNRAKNLMLDLYNSAPITRMCYAGYLVFTVTLIVSIVSGTAALPLWAALFTILPVFLILAPFRIIGTLHIAAMISMLAWIFLM